MINPVISSSENSKIKNLVKLRAKKHRDQQKKMLVDGQKSILLGIKNGFAVESVFYIESLPNEELLTAALKNNIQLQPVSANVFGKIGYGDNPDGWLALMPQPDFKLENLSKPYISFYIISEGIEKPG